jgi:hypothetical protein
MRHCRLVAKNDIVSSFYCLQKMRMNIYVLTSFDLYYIFQTCRVFLNRHGF